MTDKHKISIDYKTDIEVEISAVGLFDGPKPDDGNLLTHAVFPGDAKVILYPSAGQTLTFPQQGVELNFLARGESQELMRVRPLAAAITVKGNQVYLHPPANELVAAARVCRQLGFPFEGAETPARLALKLIAQHYPDALLAAGRKLSSDERLMSIAYVVDLYREPKETSKEALARIRPILEDYGLIDSHTATSTLGQYFNEGLALLADHKLIPWNRGKRGRPKKKS